MTITHALAGNGGLNPLGLGGEGRVRPVRRPFTPSTAPGPYLLPRDASDKLAAALTPYKNQEAAFALAVFLRRFWSSRARLVRAFPIDRRALADRDDLGLTEARIRGAIAVLEEVGFLNRGKGPAGSAYKATPDGLRRKPITFGFGPESSADWRPSDVRQAVISFGAGRELTDPHSANRRTVTDPRLLASGR